jgi:hypothetical protein
MPRPPRRLESTLTGGNGASWLCACVGMIAAALASKAARRVGEINLENG